MKNSCLFILLIVFLYSCDVDKKTEIFEGEESDIENIVFEEVSASQSRLYFNNLIEENEKLNHFNYQSIYNGGGVGTADINNDGLLDIYFCGNMESDKLFLNKGNFVFEDISKSAGIEEKDRWSTGVSFVDVNNDGYLDIYVCVTSGSRDPKRRVNRLYINQKDNTFLEMAAKYGLADQGYSMQSTFIDIDNDGDLDMFLCNEPIDYRLSNNKEQAEKIPTKYNSNKLYRQVKGNKFVDISKAGGVWDFSYSLSGTATDVNQDGFVDLYVCNDFDVSDKLFINNKNIGFDNHVKQKMGHTSYFSMGSDIADFNNDGFFDIATVDMAGSSHYRSKTNMGSMSNKAFWKIISDGEYFQYMFNTLQMNNGNTTFSDIGQLAGMAGTDWSWSILLADFDNDGYKDLTVTNGIQKDIRNNDFIDRTFKQIKKKGREKALIDAVSDVPSTPIPNYMLKNNGDLTFDNVTKNWGFFNPGFSNGMAYADFDNDGDLDIVINNMSSNASLYRNTTSDKSKNHYLKFNLIGPKGNMNSHGARIHIYYEEEQQVYEINGTRGYFSFSDTRPNFGLGDVTKVDSVVVVWPGGAKVALNDVSVDQTLTLNILEANTKFDYDNTIESTVFKEITDKLGISFQHNENEYDDFRREILIPYKESQNGPYISLADINKDGVDDFYIGNAIGFAGELYLGKKNGSYIKQKIGAFEIDKNYEDMESVFFDSDNDGDLDLYVVSGGNEFKLNSYMYQDRLYINDGNGNFSKSTNALPKMYTSGQSIAVTDIDNDNDDDIVVCNRLVPGKYPTSDNSYLLLNKNGVFEDATDQLAPEIRNCGMITKVLFSDFDGDKDMDLVMVGEWTSILFFENDNGQFVNVTKDSGLSSLTGIWWTIQHGDFDNDGDLDYIAGNLSKNNKFHASTEKPFSVYASDFDNNGSNDIVLAKFSGEKQVPVRGRECSSQQMPYIKDKFNTYDKFAKAGLEDILPLDYKEASIFNANTLASVYIENIWNGKFESKELPMGFQTAPIRSIVVTDINDDGNLDWIGVGNIFQAEVETTRYDAGTGYVALGNGKGEFRLMNVEQSGLLCSDDTRDVKITADGDIIIASNQSKLRIFSK